MAPSVLITGCTEGSIGESLAREFAHRGYRVYATARRVESMGKLGEASPLITLLSLDVTSRPSLAAVHDRIASDTNGTLDIIYHNAGRRAIAMAIDSDPKLTHDGVEDEQIFATNLFGVMAANRMFSDLLVAAQGKVVITGSLSSRVPQPTQSAYNASKAALEMYARILRMELAPLGVRVVLVNTGGVSTHMSLQRLEVAPGSFYQSIETKINETWKGYESGGMDPVTYARTVVDKVVKKSPPDIVWAGSNATLVWVIEMLGLQWVYGYIIPPQYGLNKPIVDERKA